MMLENCAVSRSAIAMEHRHLRSVDGDAPMPISKHTKNIGHLIQEMSQAIPGADPASPSNTDILKKVDVSQMPHLT